MNITIKDIAKIAGVSANTVSRALNKKKEISEETRKRIEKIAKELNYSPNSIAASLASKKTKMVGVITSDISDPFHAQQVRGIEDKVREKGYSVILINTEENPEIELQAVNTFRSIRVAGIILNSIFPSLQHIEELMGQNIPLVLLNRRSNNIDTDYVINDNFLGASIVAKYLIKLGHTRVGLILGSPRITSVHERLAGFSKTMKEAGIPVEEDLVVYSESLNPEAGERMTNQLLAKESRPTAIFTYCDTLAIGAYAAVTKMGLSIPHDISLVGYDDILFASYFETPLTTVNQPAYAMGQAACEIILERINSRSEGLILKDLPKKQIMFEPHLVVRKSCSANK